MSKQRTFEAVAAHLLSQRESSVRHDIQGISHCAYRGERGLRCAIGALIPDSLYREDFEGVLADAAPVADVLRGLGHDPAFCRRLQLLHDAFEPAEWEWRLQGFAKVQGLDARGVL